MQFVIKKNKIQELKEYFIIALIILATDTLWFRASFRPINYYIIDILGLISGSYILVNKKAKKSYIPLFVMMFCVILAQVMNISTDMLGIYKITVILLAIKLTIDIPFNKFANKFVNLIIILAIVSILCILGKTIILNLFSLKIINNGAIEFYTLYIMNFYKNIYGGFLERNVGAFWEPGAYQAYLILAIIFLNFVVVNKKNLLIKNIILVITIFSTMSTTGIVCLCLFALAIIFDKDLKNPLIKIVAILIMIVLLVMVLGNDYIQEILFSKFNVDSKGYISFATRSNAILNEFQIIFKSPFLGVGINKYQLLYENIALTYFMDPVTTSTSLASWSMFGIVYFCIYNWGYIKIAKNLSKKFISFLIICIIFLIILNTENWIFSLPFNILFVYGILEKKNNLDMINDEFIE